MNFLRANPMMIGILAGLAIFTILCLFIGFLMVRSGASLRPLIWFVGFAGIIGGPQILFHTAQAFGWIPKADLTWTPESTRRLPPSPWKENEPSLSDKDGRFLHPEQVFGPDVDPSLVSDFRPALTQFLAGQAQPEVAQMGVTRNSEMAWAIRFADPLQARDSRRRLIALMGATTAGNEASSDWLLRRPAGDVVKLIHAGRTLLAFSAATPEAAERRVAASQAIVRSDPSAPTIAESPMAQAGRKHWLYRMPVMLTIGAVMLVAAVLWFFKGIAWASRTDPEAGVAPITAAELQRRLLALNTLDAPFHAEVLADGSGVAVTWRYADAKWVDLARARGMRKTFRMVLRLDEAAHKVRVTDYFAAYDWSAGRGGASINWYKSTGITLFQVEKGAVFGIQLGPEGLPRPQLGYSYSFNLQELRAPAIAAVTGGGWAWQPVSFPGPASLRWLTE